MSSSFNEEGGPLPPRVLKAPLEVVKTLLQLKENRDPLFLTFPERSQRFQSSLIEVERTQSKIIFDEMIPTDGERFLKNGEAFHVEAFHDGIRITWECKSTMQFSEQDGARCYVTSLPSELVYHQRRNAFRATIKYSQAIKAELSDSKFKLSALGQLLDISGTGCKLSFPGDISQKVQSGQVYERLSAQLPMGKLTVQVELRHVHYDDKRNKTELGMRFHRASGLEQRLIERFVFQLQREARDQE